MLWCNLCHDVTLRYGVSQCNVMMLPSVIVLAHNVMMFPCVIVLAHVMILPHVMVLAHVMKLPLVMVSPYYDIT